MNRFELICKYCGFSWEINYTPQEEVRCAQCKDTAIRVIDIYRDKPDYYIGCPPFEEKQEKWNI